ncbi:oxidoreductase [Asanoa ishikariensis]|uniref:Predicted dehydrogenase n=1 Tax=Asanoa ishikariensis TaxID=137265 RepID=A0A1H3R3Y7_9ACTN|nr:Gfo/Idh/MocA family oxidoreductase [Asanoa ishikariensis]GIF64429.1 oxidoreductase [Asanoa ishikariensis]SDZ20514.1 Predicted dehydrogenase [Asanoa ishikariensis]
MPLRFGLFGTGPWATATQGPAIVAHPDAELVGVWGRDPDKAAALAETTGSRAYSDIDELLGDVDAVAVALPPDVQPEIAERAAKAGRHLLLDKPLALTVPAADRVVAAVDAAGVASVVFFTARFQDNVTAALRELAAAGGWQGGRVAHLASIFQPGNPYGASPWRRTYGGLWDVGPHALSQVLPVLGPVTEVSAVEGPRSTTNLLLRHESGAVSTVTLSVDAPPAAVLRDITFFGEHGVREVPRGEGEVRDAFGRAIDLLIAEVAGAKHDIGVHFGREVVGVLAAAERSRDTGSVVRL